MIRSENLDSFNFIFKHFFNLINNITKFIIMDEDQTLIPFFK